MIIRAPRPRAHFTVLDNRVLRDSTLSWKARGLLAYLLSQPDGWRTSSERLARVGPDGRDAVRSAMRELEDRGYVARLRRQDDAGRWQTLVVVREDPDAPPTVDPPGDNSPNCPPPTPGNPTPGNPAIYEEPFTKDVPGLVATRVSKAQPQLCRTCDGTGWRVLLGDLHRCTCDAGVRT